MLKTTSFVIYDQTTHTFYSERGNICYNIHGAKHFSSFETAYKELNKDDYLIELMPDMFYAKVVRVETRLVVKE